MRLLQDGGGRWAGDRGAGCPLLALDRAWPTDTLTDMHDPELPVAWSPLSPLPFATGKGLGCRATHPPGPLLPKSQLIRNGRSQAA